MIAKILNIVWKDLYITYTDRNLLLIMIATPLALATIISAAFSNLLSPSAPAPVMNIPVAVVNLDQGVDLNGTRTNNGQIFVDALVPPQNADAETLAGNALFQLTDAVQLASPELARSGVASGEYAVAVIIPSDFSEKITYSQEHPTLEPVSVDVIGSPAAPVSAGIIRSVVASISSSIVTGNVSVAATINALVERATSDPSFGIPFGLASASGAFQPDFNSAFDPNANPIDVELQAVTGEQRTFNPLVFFGAGQAVFFMLFTAMGATTNILEERRDGTLQRMVISPTSRLEILLGKLIGTFVTCLVQVLFLFIALTLVGSLMSGQLTLIWGSNVLGIFATVFAVALAATGLSAIVIAFVRSAETGNSIGGIVAMFMGIFGGVFFDVTVIPALAPLSRLTITYWGTDAFTKLAANQSDIGLNLLVLAGMGIVMFSAGFAVFNRRLQF